MKSKILYLLLNIIIAVVVSSFIFDLKHQDTRIIKIENFFDGSSFVRLDPYLNKLFPRGTDINLVRIAMEQSGFRERDSSGYKSLPSAVDSVLYSAYTRCPTWIGIIAYCETKIFTEYDKNNQVIGIDAVAGAYPF